jgi:hypothetical protein
MLHRNLRRSRATLARFVGPDFAAGGVMLVGLKHNGEQLFAPVAMQFYSA